MARLFSILAFVAGLFATTLAFAADIPLKHRYGDSVGCSVLDGEPVTTDTYFFFDNKSYGGHEWLCEYLQVHPVQVGDQVSIWTAIVYCSGEGEDSSQLVTLREENGELRLSHSNGTVQTAKPCR